MRDYLTLSSTPIDEDCAQVGSNDYHKQSVIESRIYIKQLQRLFPTDCGAYFKTKSFPHDFGSYVELVVMFDPDNEAETRYAYHVESSLPEKWDAEALAELETYKQPQEYKPMTIGAILQHKHNNQ